MSIVFSQLPSITNGALLRCPLDTAIEQLSTDSRLSPASTNVLFFAIKGKNHNGHDYLLDLYKKGIRLFVVETVSPNSLQELPNANILLVENSLAALQDIAAYHRQTFQLPVVAVTGSNGKTIVKEWLYQLLSPDFSIVKSPKSYNSQLGVPLSVWQINISHTLGIFEAGVSRSGEMQHLERIIQPTMGIFTNIGPAHNEGFDSLAQKIAEKALLFKHCHHLFCCSDHTEVWKHLQTSYPNATLVSWGFKEGGTWKVQTQKSRKSTHIELIGLSTTHSFSLPFTDDASIENILHCMVALLHLQVVPSVIQERISGIVNIPMRLELKAGRDNNYLIDDTYNNDPEGLRIALQFMQQQDMKRQKMVILSDMLETGIPPELLYPRVAALLKEKGISHFIGIGSAIGNYKGHFPSHSWFYPDTASFLQVLPNLRLENFLILIKGARKAHFEQVVQMLAQKIHRTLLEINLNALAHNLNVFKGMLPANTKLMIMVKAFAYGSGSFEVAHLLQYHKVDYLAVAYTDEGIALRENNIQLPIMVMNPTTDEFGKLVQYNLQPEIYSFHQLDALLQFLVQAGKEVLKQIPIHLAIDTGMHRLGFEAPDIDKLCLRLQASGVRVVSIFSHLVGADGFEHDEFTNHQAIAFQSIAKKIEDQLGYPVIKHLLNSPGITRFPQYTLDMVRLGIGLYGIESLGHPQDKKLQSVGTLKTIISQIRTVKKGESVGYSRKGLAEHDLKVATLAIGYADGYARILSNGVGKVWINGQFAPIIGNICMDMCMVDITEIEAQEGDEVELFGPHLSVNTVAEWSKTISYEILTSVSERVKRVFYLD